MIYKISHYFSISKNDGFIHLKELGLIVKTVIPRCIYYTRCVEFFIKIAGVKDLKFLVKKILVK